MKYLNKYYWLYAFLAITYLASFFVEKPNQTVLDLYDISYDTLFLINLSAAIPLLLIWFVLFYGFIKLRQYAKGIADDNDGKGFLFISAGVGALAIGMSSAGALTRWLINAVNSGIIDRQTMAIVDTHIAILYPLIAYILIALGARKLVQTLGDTTIEPWRKLSASFAFAFLSTLYLFFTFANPNREYTSTVGMPSYFMPDWLILTTIAIPFVATLALANTAILLIHVYRLRVRGTIYKSALSSLNIGITVSIGALSMAQFISASSATIISWGVGSILALIYVLIIVLAIGFVFIANGAKALTKLEEATDV